MLHRIRAFLEESPGSKAKSIAAGLGLDRKDVNRLLHESKDDFEQDLNFDWFTVSRVCTIEFPEGACESPRILWRLNTLRGLSHEEVEQVLTRGA